MISGSFTLSVMATGMETVAANEFARVLFVMAVNSAKRTDELEFDVSEAERVPGLEADIGATLAGCRSSLPSNLDIKA